jgi:hypothetical protein
MPTFANDDTGTHYGSVAGSPDGRARSLATPTAASRCDVDVDRKTITGGINNFNAAMETLLNLESKGKYRIQTDADVQEYNALFHRTGETRGTGSGAFDDNATYPGDGCGDDDRHASYSLMDGGGSPAATPPMMRAL